MCVAASFLCDFASYMTDIINGEIMSILLKFSCVHGLQCYHPSLLQQQMDQCSSHLLSDRTAFH